MYQQLYDELFSVFQTNKITLTRFDSYLKDRTGFQYDATLFGQLVELSMDGDNVDLASFIQAYLETQDTLAFRSEVSVNRLKELRLLQHQLQDQLKDKPLNETLIIQVIDVQNLECDGSIHIALNDQKTRSVHTTNPIFGEQFEIAAQDLNITLIQDPQHELGTLRFSLQEMKEYKLKDISANILKQGLKLRTKIHLIIKYIQSKEGLYKQEAAKVQEEINNLQAEDRENRLASQALGNIFRFNTQPTKLPPILEIQQFESKYVDILDEYVNDWYKITVYLTGAMIALVLMCSLYRTEFTDLTLLAVLTLLIVLKEMSQRFLRALTYLFILQMLSDFIWVCLCVGVKLYYILELLKTRWIDREIRNLLEFPETDRESAFYDQFMAQFNKI